MSRSPHSPTYTSLARVELPWVRFSGMFAVMNFATGSTLGGCLKGWFVVSFRRSRAPAVRGE